MASLSDAIITEDSVNSNLITFMVDSEVLGHYLDDAIIRDLKHRLQGYVHPLRPARFSLPGELCRTVRWKACCKALSPTTTATKSSFGSIS